MKERLDGFIDKLADDIYEYSMHYDNEGILNIEVCDISSKEWIYYEKSDIVGWLRTLKEIRYTHEYYAESLSYMDTDDDGYEELKSIVERVSWLMEKMEREDL